jgi:flagellar basal body-associated protein FliL
MKRSDIYKIIIIVLVLTMLLLGGGFAFGAFEGIGWHGIGALVVGVTLSLALGVGLMVLMYASSRSHDEEAHFAAKKTFKDDSESSPAPRSGKTKR